jgi:putative membrane protein
MMGYGGCVGCIWMLGGGLVMLVFFIGLIALLVWGVINWRTGQRSSAHDETPLESLRRRYASGEISQEEFEQTRGTLVGGSTRQKGV